MAMISEMEFMQGEIQSHSVDVLDSSLALIRSAMSVKDILREVGDSEDYANYIAYKLKEEEEFA